MPLPDLDVPQDPGTPFEFVRRLALDLSNGTVRLPSLPDVAERVRRVLDNERATAVQIAQVVASDAALAARVLRIANSAAFNPGGTPVTDLRTAVGRLGHDLVRCAAVAFAISQLRQTGATPEIRARMVELWRDGTLVAALAYVLARHVCEPNPDAALVTGLLHNVGCLYIVTHAAASRDARESGAEWERMVHEWHPQIGRSILEHWNFPEGICEAIGDQNVGATRGAGATRLKDVLACAVALVPCAWYREQVDEIVAAAPAFARLQVDADDCRRLLATSGQQIRQLRDTLAG